MSFWSNPLARSKATPLQAAVSAQREGRSTETVGLSTEETGTGLLANLFGGYTNSGMAVSETSALALTAVYACVNNISQDLAGLPCHVLADSATGRAKLSGHPVGYVLNKRANERQNAFHFRQSMFAATLLHGNAYAIIERDARQQVTALHYQHPGKATVTELEGRLWYKFSANGRTYADYEVLHFRGLSLTGVLGISPLRAHRETFGAGLAAQKASAAFYQNGARPSGILSTEQQFKDVTKARQMQEQWNSLYGGAGNAGQTVVLEAGLKYQPVSLPPADAQYIQQAGLTRADVASIYRMPPHKIQDLSRSTNNNIEQQSLDYVGDALMPWVLMAEQECSLKLFRVVEQLSHYVKHNLDGLLRPDATARANYYGKMLSSGVYSINEVRALEEQNGIGTDGDLHLVQGAMLPIGLLGQPAATPQNSPTDA